MTTRRPSLTHITAGGRIRAAAIAVVVALSLASAPAWAAPSVGKPPVPKPVEPVPTSPVRAASAQAGPAVPDGTRRPAAVWPAPGAVDVAVPSAPRGRLFGEDGAGSAKAGGLPVWVGRAAVGSAPTRVRVEALDRARTAAAGVQGLLLRVNRADGDGPAGTVQVTVDYRGFRNAYGADWATRLRLVVLPECTLTTPGRPDCAGRVLPTTNDWRTGALTASVPMTGSTGTLVAAMAGTSGPSGDFKATSLAPSSTWSAGGNSGDFSWSYPMRAPPAVGGPAPQMALSYSAQSVDGRQPAANNQPSIVGEGFELSAGGFIERRYKACNDDKGAGANNTTDVGDQCWVTDNATLSLGGHSGELLYNATENRWHLRSDDGSRIQRFTGATNGDDNGEHWVVTTTDGTQYWFGLNRLPGWTSTRPETGSTWTAPVFGNHPGEPCHATAFANSSCTQAWRWNLDYVVDTHGNTMSQWYGKDTNKYARNLATSSPVSYVRGGWLDHVDYGTDQRTLVGGNPSDSVFNGTAPARIIFGYGDRCLSGCAIHDGTHWPDTPWDTECTGSTCNTVSPTFWTTRRLSTVTTKVWDAAAIPAAHRDVERWTLTHTFPDPGDTNRPGLWLDRIGHAGLAGGQNTTVPDITFTPVTLNNRVDGIDHSSSMNWHRIAKITTETGGTISVTYQGSDCTAAGPKPAPHNNSTRCYPVNWKPEGFTTPVVDWFNKYVVTTIYEADETGGTPPFGSPRVAYNYSYLGAPAWRYTDDDGLVQADYKTWSEWRGYAEVAVTVGDPGEQTYTKTRYFRGMHGDKQPSGTRTVIIDGINDENWWAGATREQITYNGPGGAEVSATLNTPWASAPTASRTVNGDTVTARFANTAVVATRTALDGGRPARVARITNTFDGYGMVVQTDDEGDLAVVDDQQCVKTGFEPRNTAGWILGLAHEVHTFAVGCALASNPTTLADADVISGVRTSYDGQVWSTAPVRGRPTVTQRAKAWNSGSPAFITTSGASYDVHGRPVDTWDALNRHTTIAYTPSTGGPVTATALTNALSHVSTSYLDPGWGMSSATVDANVKRTDLAYDGLGRLTSLWLPGRVKGTHTANMLFGYLVRNDAPSVVSTATLNPTGSGYVTAYAFFDGMLRSRQSQTPSPSLSGGRIVADTFYDAAGRTVRTYGSYYDGGGPAGTTLVQPNDPTDVPNQNRMVYDGSGRVTATIFQPYAVERWRTSTGYGGDRTDVTPPNGGTATSTVVDARGRDVQLRQYQAATPTGSHDATTYAYNRKGQLVTVTDPVGNHWDYTYDLLGRQTKVVDPDKGTTTSVYDDAGQLTSTTDARNKKLIYLYDELGRKRSMYHTVIGSGTIRARWMYDTVAKGHLTKSTRYFGTPTQSEYVDEITAYNDRYQPLINKITIPSAETGLNGIYQYSNSYNVDGSPSSALTPATGDLPEESVYVDYDDMGLPHTLTSRYNSPTTNNSYVTDTRYNALAQVDQLTLYTGYFSGTGSKAWLTNERELETGRLVGLTTTRQTGTQTTLADLDYSFDHAGNITKISDPVSGDHRCFRQDYLRRLSEAWTPSSGNCATNPTAAGLGGPAPYWLSWTYGKTGNRLTQVEHAAPAGDATTTYTVPAAGAVRPHTVTGTSRTDGGGTQTGSYTYDAAGNTLTRPAPSAGTQTLTWDPEGHLATSADPTGTTTYIYDADGTRLVRRDPTGKTLYLPGQELRYDNATATRSCSRYYTYGGVIIASRTAAGLTWLAGDHQGTAQVAVNEATQQATERRQSPFGLPRGTSPTWPNSKGFVDGTQDNTGLIHLGAREYDPAIGRFISVDPIMDLGDPQQMHGYAYANNTPVTLADPDGLLPPNICLDECGSTDDEAFQSGQRADRARDRAQERAGGGGGGARRPSEPGDVKREIYYSNHTVVKVLYNGVIIIQVPNAEPYAIQCAPNCPDAYELGQKIDYILGQVGNDGNYPRLAVEFALIACEQANPRFCSGIRSQMDFDRYALIAGDMEMAAMWVPGFAAISSGRNRGHSGGCARNSFSPATPVLMADGSTRAIKDVKVGDEVLATDPETGRTEVKKVTATIVGVGTKDLVTVTIDIDGARGNAVATIIATAGHPFWVESRRAWQDASELRPNDYLLSPRGNLSQVESIRRYSVVASVYNLTVDDIHTYYVLAGNTPILVHNTPPGACRITSASGSPKVYSQTVWKDTNGTMRVDVENPNPGAPGAAGFHVQFMGRGADPAKYYYSPGNGTWVSKDGAVLSSRTAAQIPQSAIDKANQYLGIP